MITLRTLGPLDLRDAEGRPIVSLLSQPHRLALLAYLAIAQSRGFHRRDSLLVLLWPEADEKRARNSLSASLSMFRRSLGRESVVKRGMHEVGLERERLWCDAVALEETVAAGRPAEAIELYRGPFLDGFVIPGAQEWMHWADGERVRLRRLAEEALQRLAAAADGSVESRAALRLAHRLAAEDPYNAQTVLALMRLLAGAGDLSGALRQADTFQERLAQELGADPDPEVAALAEQVRSGAMEIRPADHGAMEIGPEDYGAMVIRPEDPGTVGAAGPPPPASPAETGGSNGQLPSGEIGRAPRPGLTALPPVTLVGREAELIELHRLLLREEVRLATLTGPGGVGKTRLALEVARNSAAHGTRGVVLVELAALTDTALVLPAVAGALGIRATGSIPLLDTLRAHLRNRSLLLVLDNLEHLLDATPVISALLAAAPSLKVLATSRAPLHVAGEREFPVSPLALPEPARPPHPDELLGYGAIELFLRRARAAKPGFALTPVNAAAVAEICTWLDGLPLAIELAAARVKLLPPPALLARLQRSRLELLTGGAPDQPARQQTLRDTLAWSYALLEEGEQALFRRLSVFVGGCALEAAEAICGDTGAPDTEVLDGIGLLVDSSLLLAEEHEQEARFRMLETIREYGHELLETDEEAPELRRRHTSFFLSLAEQAQPHLLGCEQVTWLARLESDHDNLRGALRRALDEEDVVSALRLVDALWLFWIMRGHLGEGGERLGEVLALPRAAELPAEQAKVMIGAGAVAYWRGDYAQAAALCAEGLPLCSAVGARWHSALALCILGTLAFNQGELERARTLCSTGQALADELDNRWLSCILHLLQSLLALQEADAERAVQLSREGLELAREVGELWVINLALGNLGFVLSTLGEHEQAHPCFVEGLTICSQLGYYLGVSQNLDDLAGVAVGGGEFVRAARLLGAGEALREVLGVGVPLANTANYERICTLVREGLDGSSFAEARAEGRAMPLEQAIEYGRDIYTG